MQNQNRFATWLARLAFSTVLSLIAIAGCSTSSETPPRNTTAGTGTAQSTGGSAGASGGAGATSSSTGGATVTIGMGGGATTPDGGSCDVDCKPRGGQYCGEIGNNCGGKVMCPACAGDWLCDKGLCIGGASCKKTVCENVGSRFCGTVGDNCGGALTCGDCPSGQTCSGGVCVSVNCTPLQCQSQGWNYCGTIGDGCGSTLTCGTCPNNGVCGSAVANVCGASADCKKLSCTTSGGQYCGTIGDGCGGSLDCATCPAGQSCNANKICVKNGCVPATCSNGTTRFCGQIGDGCGGTLECGTCAGGEVCGTTAHPSVCLPANCTPIKCDAVGGGRYCGVIGDGCGGQLDCGTTCPNNGVCDKNICPGTGGTSCSGLQCKIEKCATGNTTLSGTVYDPAGILPIYNAVVYVPNAPLEPIPTGASCDKCGAIASGQPIATALTDVKGQFVMKDVPTGTNIPLVIQVGKWRRQVTIPNVASCVETAIANPADANQKLLRLPRTQAEGNIPRIAMSSGGSDSLECLVRRIGVADSEFTTPTGTGRIHMYAGLNKGVDSFDAAHGGQTFPSWTTLMSSADKMKTYDMIVMSCEGSQYAEEKKPYLPNFESYVNAGGRTFLSHVYWPGR
jgi:hypothetical protein